MGGPGEVRAWCDDAEPLHTVYAELQRLESKYSRFLGDSLTTKINNSAGKELVELDDETLALLNYADEAWHVSGGLFDITAGTLNRVWNFKERAVPERARVEAILPYVGWDKVRLEGNRLFLPAGMELDFGGLVKEYAVDRAIDILKSQGIFHGLVELAGDLAATGPLPDGTPWLVKIRNPRSEETSADRIEISSGAVATSGDYERCILVDGVRYSHILNPSTGWPARGLASVTVQHERCIVAGALSTIAILKGESGEAWLEGQGIEYRAIAS